MSDFYPKSLCILGRQPELGLAELESLYGAEHVRPIAGAALLDVEAGEINFKRLGGTVKVARLLNILPTTNWDRLEKYLLGSIPEHLKYLPEGKFTLGLSVYGEPVKTEVINRSLLKIKKLVRASGRPVRVVPNKEPALSSAQVLHNKLTSRGGWELLFVVERERTILAQTFFVQDIEAYAARDQVRPKRDARVGMLSPKLAQIILNLANPPAGSLVLDPFCGTGVLLQEALLMGYKVAGADIDPRLVDYAKTNLKWLKDTAGVRGEAQIEQADATKLRVSSKIGAVASEIYLGQPLTSFPAPDVLSKNVKDTGDLLEKFLANMAGQLPVGSRLCLAVPAWKSRSGKLTQLPIIDRLTDMGYNYLDLKYVPRKELVYHRPNQIVARQLLRIARS